MARLRVWLLLACLLGACEGTESGNPSDRAAGGGQSGSSGAGRGGAGGKGGTGGVGGSEMDGGTEDDAGS